MTKRLERVIAVGSPEGEIRMELGIQCRPTGEENYHSKVSQKLNARRVL